MGAGSLFLQDRKWGPGRAPSPGKPPSKHEHQGPPTSSLWPKRQCLQPAGLRGHLPVPPPAGQASPPTGRLYSSCPVQGRLLPTPGGQLFLPPPPPSACVPAQLTCEQSSGMQSPGSPETGLACPRRARLGALVRATSAATRQLQRRRWGLGLGPGQRAVLPTHAVTPTAPGGSPLPVRGACPSEEEGEPGAGLRVGWPWWPSLTAGPRRPGRGAGPVPVSVEALRRGAEHGLRDAETHPPGPPGVRAQPAGWGAGRAGAGPTLQPPPALSPAGGRQSQNRVTARRTFTTRSWTSVWRC